jgi:lipid-binding SYLF domain-containing protein
MTAIRANVLRVGLAAAAIVICAARAANARPMDADVSAALKSLYANNAAAQLLGSKAKAVLVFPRIVKAGFMVGAQTGEGALREGKRTVGYYRSSAASYGFQAGVQWFGYALFFMNASALDYLRKSGGWEIGTGPSVVVMDEGKAKQFSTTTVQSDVYAFIFGQKGLMAGVGIQGTKITRLKS